MFSDSELAGYLARALLKKSSLPILQILEDAGMDDRQFRESLIRLFFQGRVFGRLDGRHLIFNTKNAAISIEEMLDWSVSDFNLSNLINVSVTKQETNTNEIHDDNESLIHEMHAGVSSEVVITKAKEVSTTDLISCESRFLFAGNKLNLRIFIRNNSTVEIENIRIKLDYPYKIIQYRNIRPDLQVQVDEKNIWITIGTLAPEGTKNLTLIFQEITNGKIEVDGFVQYKSTEGFIRFLTMQHTVYEFQMPLLLPSMMCASDIQNFMKTKSVYRNIISYGIPGNLTVEQAQDYLEKSIADLGLTSISTIRKEDSIIHFMAGKIVTPEGAQLELLVVPQTKAGIMEIYAACKNDQIVSNLLRHASRMLKMYLMQDHIIGFLTTLVDLNCVKCGAVLGKMPQQKEEITCPNCQTPQIPWN
jgi:hypothetical protein